MTKLPRGHPTTQRKGEAAEICKKAFLHFGAGVNTLCTPVFLQRGYQKLINFYDLKVLHSGRTFYFFIK